MISEVNNLNGFNTQISNQPANQGNKQKLSEEGFQQKAQSMGVPEDIIKQGRQAVKEWVMGNKQNTTSSDNSTDSQSVLKKEEKNKSDSSVDIFA